jgi:uncharacterized protein
MEVLTVDTFYSEGAKGRLLGVKCEQGHVSVPPRTSCEVCGSRNVSATKLSGRGEVISFTEVFSKARDFPLDTPYVLALLRLQEGGKLLGVADNPAKNVAHGTKVKVEFRRIKSDGESAWPRIFFVPL